MKSNYHRNHSNGLSTFRTCTNPYHHCVFGIDPTFNLGPCNVTVTTYKQFQLVGQAPTFVGPLFIHYRKTFVAITLLHLVCWD